MKTTRWAAALAAVLIFLFLASAAAAYDNPFRVRVRASYPQGMKTVGEAASHLLETIDYRLILTPPAPPEAREISRAGIGPLARSGDVMPLEDALLLLVGERNRVVVDHVHRLVTFEEIPGGTL